MAEYGLRPCLTKLTKLKNVELDQTSTAIMKSASLCASLILSGSCISPGVALQVTPQKRSLLRKPTGVTAHY